MYFEKLVGKVDICKAIIISTKKKTKRLDGTTIISILAVLINENIKNL